MTQVIDRSKEKLELATELGLKGYVNTKRMEVEKKEAIEELTKMNFKPITEEEISERLTKRLFHKKLFHDYSFLEAGIIGSLVLTIAILTSLATAYFAPEVEMKEAALSISGICSGFSLFLMSVRFLACFMNTEIKRKLLINWPDELPYGALLAVKEAAARGVVGLEDYLVSKTSPGSYVISYPVYSDGARYKADPIIWGFYKGQQVEIFSWDDGKIYE